MNRTIMDELREVVGPAATAKIARAMLYGDDYPLLRAAISDSLNNNRKVE